LKTLACACDDMAEKTEPRQEQKSDDQKAKEKRRSEVMSEARDKKMNVSVNLMVEALKS